MISGIFDVGETQVFQNCNDKIVTTTPRSSTPRDCNDKCIEQKSLTDHEPKRIRRYDGTHVNIASFVNRFSKQGMTGTMISRHVGELVPLTIEQYRAWQGNQQ